MMQLISALPNRLFYLLQSLLSPCSLTRAQVLSHASGGGGGEDLLYLLKFKNASPSAEMPGSCKHT